MLGVDFRLTPAHIQGQEQAHVRHPQAATQAFRRAQAATAAATEPRRHHQKSRTLGQQHRPAAAEAGSAKINRGREGVSAAGG